MLIDADVAVISNIDGAKDNCTNSHEDMMVSI
jgi:hypothetical protein